jgi:hypothetical protein
MTPEIPPAKVQLRSDYVTRETILNFLSDEETAKLSSIEGTPQLVDGEAYLDLEHLDRGVLRANPSAGLPSGLLPQRAVRETTWTAILATLAGFPAVVAPPTIADSAQDDITLPPGTSRSPGLSPRRD